MDALQTKTDAVGLSSYCSCAAVAATTASADLAADAADVEKADAVPSSGLYLSFAAAVVAASN